MNTIGTHVSSDKFRVVILYDHYESVGRAMSAYAHLTRELESEGQPDLRIWRLDVATAADCAPEAGEEIAGADLIIVAARGNGSCPPEFQRWLEEGRAAPRRILALVDSPGTSGPAVGTWKSVFRSAATRTDSTVFVYEPEGTASDAPPGVAACPVGTG